MQIVTRGCATIILAAGIVLVIAFAGMTSMARSFADWRVSANAVTVAQVNADAAVDIAQINADATVEVAQINADATRDTSMAYLAHRMLTAVLWAAGLVWTAVAALFVGRWMAVKYAGN